uniref:Serpentine receptor class gamma n=2 Tax=Panagrellus redivivus TaxID=6233 RepID=A0A7E4VPS6_PANRE
MIALPPPYADIYAIVVLLCVIPTYCLYGIIAYLVFLSPHRRYYQGPFYKMFVVATGIAFILTVGIYFQGHVLGAPIFLPFVESLPHTGFLPTFFLCFLYYGIYAGQLINCALSFNRFSIIILKQSYHIFWNKYFRYLIFGILTTPILLVWQFIISNVRIYIFDDNNESMGYHLMDFDPPKWANKGKVMIGIYAVTAILSIIMNSVTLVFLVKNSNITKNKSSDKNDDSSPNNIRFFICIMMSFVAESMTAVIQGLMNVIRYGTCTNPYLYTLQVLVSEFATLGPPWYLFLMSDELRRDMMGTIRGQAISKVNVTQSRMFTVVSERQRSTL